MPGSLRTVAVTRLPGGGGQLQMRANRYGFEGRVYFDLTDWIQRPDGSAGGSSWTPEGHAALSWTFAGDCAAAGRNATVVVFGLLRRAEDTAVAYAAGAPHRLRTAPIPASFHAGGLAAYAVLGEPPERILVRTPAGKIAIDERLSHEGPTRCKGPAELSYFRKKA
jgi:hypothetical protein